MVPQDRTQYIPGSALLLWLGFATIFLLGWNTMLDWDHRWSDSNDHKIKGQLEVQESNFFPYSLIQKSMKLLCMFVNICCTGFFNLLDNVDQMSHIVLLLDTNKLI